jgi:hypothetical protein
MVFIPNIIANTKHVSGLEVKVVHVSEKKCLTVHGEPFAANFPEIQRKITVSIYTVRM